MYGGHAFFMRAVGTTIHVAARLDTVANNPAATVFAFGSERVNGAFETIKVTRNAIVKDFQRLVVLISTNFALHNNFSFIKCSGFLVAPAPLARGPFHLIVLGVFDAFFDELFGECLFIRRGNFWRLFTDGFRHWFPALILG